MTKRSKVVEADQQPLDDIDDVALADAEASPQDDDDAAPASASTVKVTVEVDTPEGNDELGTPTTDKTPQAVQALIQKCVDYYREAKSNDIGLQPTSDSPKFAASLDKVPYCSIVVGKTNGQPHTMKFKVETLMSESKNSAALRRRIEEKRAALAKLREGKAKTPSIGVAYLIESDLDKASVLLSAGSIGDSFQDMAEKLARIEANDLIPMDKALKAQFGPEAANRFYQAAQTAVRGLLDQLKQAQDQINTEVEALRSGAPTSDMANADDHDPEGEQPAPSPDEPAPAPEGGEGGELPGDVPEMPGAEGGAPPASAGGEGGEPEVAPQPSLGRERKMSESVSDRKIVNAFVAEMNRVRDPHRAARRVAERFNIDAYDVRQIVKEAAGKA